MTYEPLIGDKVTHNGKAKLVVFTNRTSRNATLKDEERGYYDFGVPFTEIQPGVAPRPYVVGDRVTCMNLEGVWDVDATDGLYATLYGPLRNAEEDRYHLTVFTDALTIWITKEMLDALKAGEESLRRQECAPVSFGGVCGDITKAPQVTSGIPQYVPKHTKGDLVGGCMGKPLEVVGAGTGRSRMPPMSAIAEAREVGKIGHLSVIERMQLETLRIQLKYWQRHPDPLDPTEPIEVSRLLAQIEELLKS